MQTVTLADAKARSSELVDRASKGEAIAIMRRGKLIARLLAAERPRRPIDVAALRALTSSLPIQDEPAGEWMRKVRDDERF